MFALGVFLQKTKTSLLSRRKQQTHQRKRNAAYIFQRRQVAHRVPFGVHRGGASILRPTQNPARNSHLLDPQAQRGSLAQGRRRHAYSRASCCVTLQMTFPCKESPHSVCASSPSEGHLLTCDGKRRRSGSWARVEQMLCASSDVILPVKRKARRRTIAAREEGREREIEFLLTCCQHVDSSLLMEAPKRREMSRDQFDSMRDVGLSRSVPRGNSQHRPRIRTTRQRSPWKFPLHASSWRANSSRRMRCGSLMLWGSSTTA